MSLDAPSSASPAIGSLDELVGWMRVGEKPAAAHRCGIEAEKLGVRADGAPVQILGPGGVSELLRAMAAESGERLLEENGAAIGIQGANASVALEPGGQLELSGAPSASLTDLARELADHHAQVRTHSAARGLSWIAAGYRPFGVRAQVPWLPRGRYGLMRERLPGRLAHDMMQMTASVQANFDFSDEQDLAEKVSTATAISPIVTALFANSPLIDGKPSGYKTFRYRVWKDVDDRRCGLLRVMFEPGFTYRRYLDWALSVPLLFVRRQGRYLDPEGRTFADLLAHGFAGEPATMQDFGDLMSTIFPEIRVKRVIEVRGADAVDERTTMSLPALWTGILYDADARRDARALIRVPFEELVAFQDAVSRSALDARLGGTLARDLARDLVALADDGLRRRHEAGMGDERPLLDPLREIASTGRTSADRVLDVHAATGGDVTALIAAMRY